MSQVSAVSYVECGVITENVKSGVGEGNRYTDKKNLDNLLLYTLIQMAKYNHNVKKLRYLIVMECKVIYDYRLFHTVYD